MPPRSKPLPSASTASARAARAAFFCELCRKQYTRQNELEAHESSYDHLHKKRLKEMKSLQGKMAYPRKEKERENEGGLGGGGMVMSIKLGGGGVKEERSGGGGGGVGGKGAGFKKGEFKNAFAPVDGDGEEGEEGVVVGVIRKEEQEKMGSEMVGKKEVPDDDDSDVTDQDDYYDPTRPTGCHPGCPGRRVEVG